MTRGWLRATAGSVVFLIVAPGTVTVLVPWLLSGWQQRQAWPVALAVLGAILVLVGAAVVLTTFGQFVWEGRGTPAPVAPTEELVVRGLYRFSRNPMYLGVVSILVGEVLWLGSVPVAVWTGCVIVAVTLFVRGYEEPTLAARHGAAYARYSAAVPRWLPRLKPGQRTSGRRSRRTG
jgi:protein-S-isoprenylcysteine O-methyltransferase Ste14